MELTPQQFDLIAAKDDLQIFSTKDVATKDDLVATENRIIAAIEVIVKMPRSWAHN